MLIGFSGRTIAIISGFAVIALPILLHRDGSVASNRPVEHGAETKRKPWTTSQITGSPEEPPRFKAVRVFPEVKFNHPLLIVRCPGSDRLFVGEQEGVLYSLVNTPSAKREVFLDLRKEIKTIDKLPGAAGIGELYGLVFHPKFPENRTCFVCYTLTAKVAPKEGRFPDGSRVSRFKVIGTDPPRIDPASEEIILTFMGGGHNGGDLHFGPDGMLYISTGDAASPNPPDVLNTGQDCSDLLSSVLRIDVDHKDPGKNYAVPKDNPFLGLKDVRPEIWAFGFRNPWRMSIDRQTGDLWLGDVGWEMWEMVHKVEKGGNYGWSIMEGPQSIKPSQKIGPTPIRPPAIALPHTIAASVTGGYVYRGKKFPELIGAYIFGDWETRRIWAARFEDGRVKEMPEIVKPTVRPSAFGEDKDGEIYYCDYDNGMLFTLARNDAAGPNTSFPRKLSETGLFADVKRHVPAPGVISFRPNVPQWQDGARAEHFIALPGLSSVRLFDKPRPLPGQVFWHNFQMQFPKDAVLVKTISLLAMAGGKCDMKRVETQILHHDGEDWRGYSYLWRDDQSDADLVPADGAEKVVTVPTGLDADNGEFVATSKREQVWTIHSRNQCMVCHNAWAEYALAFNIRQLNGMIPNTPERGNQLVELNRDGVITRISGADKSLPAFDKNSVAREPALVQWRERVPPGPFRPADTINKIARSYLHANCAHCHRFGGGGGQVVLELDYSRPLKETGLLNEKPRQGDFGIPHARLIAPGEPYRSVLFYRMAKFGRGRMPHLGSELPDISACEEIADWIGSLDPAKGWTGRNSKPLVVERPLKSFADAWPFAAALGSQSYSIGPSGKQVPLANDPIGKKVLAEAAKLDPGLVRDLFEGYLPPDPRGRKLGSNPRPSSILNLKGDPKKGETLFFAKEMKCANCHKIGERGTSLGPDLTTIGKSRSRAEILDSLLQPSARVEPQFAAYLVRTKDEKTVTGLLVKRDDKQVIIRDAENKEHAFGAADLESVTPSRLSLMPDGQMSSLTPQEAADLLEYLVTRK